MDAATQETILRAAIAAPSADNSQPWHFAWRDDTLELAIDASRAGGVSDARFVLSDLAAGACLENLLIRGRSLGYDADVELFPGSGELCVARLCWRAAPAGGEPLVDAIESRCTERRFPLVGPIPDGPRVSLEAQARRLPEADLHWFDTKPARQAALAALRLAETLRFQSPRLHAELFSSVRFDAGWHRTCPEGLPPAALAVEMPLRPVFQALRRPAVMGLLNRLGVGHVLGVRSAMLPARLSPALGLISTAGTGRADVLAAGRALERVWLQATTDGLAMQPLAAAGVLSLGFVQLESAFDAPLARLRTQMDALCPRRHGIIFFRLGRAKSRPPPRSGRRPLSSFAGPSTPA